MEAGRLWGWRKADDHDAVRTAILGHEARTDSRGGLVAAATLVITLGYIGYTFHALVAPPLLAGLFAALALVLTGWAIALMAFLRRQPDDAEIVRIWIPIARTVMTALDLCIAASMWVLLPAADEALRWFMIVLYGWFLIIQVIASTEASEVSARAIVIVLGSLIAYALVSGFRYAEALSIFLVIFGATMFAARRFIRRAVLEASEARELAEARGRELTAALAEVAAQRDAKTRFLAAASHDLQQPIQAARLYVDHAFAPAEPERRDRAIAGARRAFASVEALLRTMLDHLRLEAGAAEARVARVSLGRLVAEVVLEHEGAARTAGVRIRTPDTALAAAADPDLLRRALGNLVANALRHGHGTRVLIAARRRAGGWVDLWVIDDGRGIATSESERLFEDYAQGPSDARGAGGFGIGLSSARRMIALQGGTIALDPRWRGGAAFVIRLRAAEPLAVEEVRCEAA